MQGAPDKKETSLTRQSIDFNSKQPTQQSVFTRKGPLKIKVNPGILNRINSSKKFPNNLSNGLSGSRTVSRGNPNGIQSAIQDAGQLNSKFLSSERERLEASGERPSAFSPFNPSAPSKQKMQDEKQYKKLFVSSEIQRPPQTDINEKEKSQQEYLLKQQMLLRTQHTMPVERQSRDQE